MSCSPGAGGPASDHQCMELAGLFDKSKWEVEEGKEWPKLLYDAGVSRKTKTAALEANFEIVTSGIVRNSKNSTLSFQQREENFSVSSLRIRVENFIGIVREAAFQNNRYHHSRGPWNDGQGCLPWLCLCCTIATTQLYCELYLYIFYVLRMDFLICILICIRKDEFNF